MPKKKSRGRRKGQSGPFNLIFAVITGLGLSAVFGVVYLLILSNLQGDLTASTAEYNATTNAITGISNVFAQYALIGTIAGLVVVLTIVIAYLFNKQRGR